MKPLSFLHGKIIQQWTDVIQEKFYNQNHEYAGLKRLCVNVDKTANDAPTLRPKTNKQKEKHG